MPFAAISRAAAGTISLAGNASAIAGTFGDFRATGRGETFAVYTHFAGAAGTGRITSATRQLLTGAAVTNIAGLARAAGVIGRTNWGIATIGINTVAVIYQLAGFASFAVLHQITHGTGH